MAYEATIYVMKSINVSTSKSVSLSSLNTISRSSPYSPGKGCQSARKNEAKGGDNDSTDDPLHVVVEAEVVLDNIKGGQHIIL